MMSAQFYEINTRFLVRQARTKCGKLHPLVSVFLPVWAKWPSHHFEAELTRSFLHIYEGGKHGAKTNNYNSQKTRRLKTSWGDGCCIQSFYISLFYLSCSFPGCLKLDCVAGTLYGLSTRTWHNICDPRPCFGFGGMLPVNDNRNLNHYKGIRMRIEHKFPVPILPLDIAGYRWFRLENPMGVPSRTSWSNRLWTLPMT